MSNFKPPRYGVLELVGKTAMVVTYSLIFAAYVAILVDLVRTHL